MYDETSKPASTTEDTLKRVGRWLKTRPIESWAFFVAGIIIARVFF